MAPEDVGLHAKVAFLSLAVGCAAAAAGYWLGLQDTDEATAAHAEESPAPTAPSSTAPQTAALRSNAAMPPTHPPMKAMSQATSGRVQVPVSGNTKFTHFRVGQRNVKRILADDDTMWVGTSGGVVRYHTKTDEYRLFDVRSGLLANGIFHVGKLDDRIVVGTYGGGMALFDAEQESWTNYNVPQGLADAFVYDVLKDIKGDVWIATWSGANRVRGGALDDPSKWDVFTVENTGGGLPNNWVYGLATDASGALWFATEGGLARFTDGGWTNWQHSDGLGAPYEQVRDQNTFKNDPAEFSRHHARQKSEMGLQDVEGAYNPNYIVSLLVDRDGFVWCGTWGGGLSRFDGTQWKTFTVHDGLPDNHVFSLHADADGTLWVGTGNGLARRNDDGFNVYTTADGLFANAVFSMATSRDGSAWVGSFGGVARLARLQ